MKRITFLNAGNIFLLAIFTVLGIIQPAKAQIAFDQTGMKSFADWGPDRFGGDAQGTTSKLQEAIDWCSKNEKTLYIPPGTYLVNKTIQVVTDGGVDLEEVTIIHGDAYDRPTIKLVDNTFTGSPSPVNAQPVFNLDHKTADKRSAWIFSNVISNLNFDLGNNPGATALQWGAAQDSHLINIKITGESFTAGIIGFPGRNQGNINLEVTGGKYGLALVNNREFGAVGINLTGVKLTGQSSAGILIQNLRGTTIVGAEILDCRGNAIEQSSGGSYEKAQLYLLDAKIQMVGNNAAMKMNDRNLVMRNVYVRGTSKIVEGNNTLTTSSPSEWTYVKTYASAQSPTSGKMAYNYINGSKKVGDELAEVRTGVPPPFNTRTKHIPDLYAWNHPNAVLAFATGDNDKAAKLQQKIDGPAEVIYIPAGKHNLDKSILLKNGKVLIGDPGKRSWLQPTYNLGGGYTFVVETENSGGYVAMQDLFINTRDQNYDGAIKWQTGGGQLLNTRVYEETKTKEPDTRVIQFSGNAGGRFFGYADHRTTPRDCRTCPRQPGVSGNFRKIYIENTTNPITFYGLNLERGGGSYEDVKQPPFCEMKNARNVRVLGTKTEPHKGNIFKVTNSQNISMNAIWTHRATTNIPFIDLQNSDKIEVGFVTTASTGGNNILIAPYDDIKKQDLVVLFRKGDFDHGIFDGEAPDPGNTYMLTVNRGSGDGSYEAGTEVTITADPATPGESFDRWTGDVQSLSNADSATTTLVMPAQGITVSATYKKSVQEAYATHTIPGTIECEHYDKGGQGIAYNDDDRREGDPSFRPGDNIDIVAKPGASNGYSIGYSREGEWAEYTLADVAMGTYDIQLSYSSGAPGAIGDLRVSLDGAELTTITDISNTGSWDTFTTVTIKDVPIPGGSDKILRLAYVNGSRFDLDAITFEASGSDPGPGCDPGSVSVLAGEGVYTQGDQVYNTGILRVESDRRVSYVQFDVSNTCGRITGATLRVTNEANESGNGTFRVYKALHSGWNDNTTNISSLPSKSGPALSSFTDSNIQGGEVLEFDVTDAITGNGVVSFIIEQESGNDIKLYSDDVSNDLLRPVLTISYGESRGAAAARKGTDTSFDPYLLKVYPNPNGGDFVIASEAPIGSIALFTLKGSPVAITSRISKDRFGARVSTGAPSGSYWLRIEYEGGRRAVKKVMVVR